MSSKRTLVGIAVALLVGLAILVVGCAQPKLETELIYKADLSATVGTADEAMTNAIRIIIKARLDAYDAKGATVERTGTDQIVVQLPAIEDLDTAIELIGQTAQFDFRELTYDSTGNPVKDENGNLVWKPAMAVDSSGKEVHLSGTYLKRNTQVVLDPKLNWPLVYFEFNSEGAALFAQITGRLIEKPLGIFLDNNCIASPLVKHKIEEGKGVIENIGLEDARNLAILLNAGALPCPLTLVSRRSLTS